MKEPEFDKEYRAARRSAFSQSISRLQQGATAAATTLLKTIIDPDAPASVRVRAAECVLNHGMKAIELDDVEARLSELERATRKQTRLDADDNSTATAQEARGEPDRSEWTWCQARGSGWRIGIG